jgi:endoglucanase
MKNKNRKTSGRQKLWLGIITTVMLFLVGICLTLSRMGHFSFTPPIAHKPYFSTETTTYPSRLSVSGNKLVDHVGQQIILKGLMFPDPARLKSKGKFNRAFIQELRDTGANVIRVPVHPEYWQQDPDYLWRYLDPIVSWSGEAGLYVIIDLHFIGNVETGAGEKMPDIQSSSKDFTVAFWRLTAAYFKDAPNVIFEIVNEPQSITPAAWRDAAAEITAVIRAAGAKQLIIVGGVEYASDLSWVLDQPVTGENIAYAAHIYPSHSPRSWDGWFGEVSKKYPVLITEWGWMETSPSPQTDYLVGSAASYGEPLMNYLQEYKIGWVACWYDDEWLPPMFKPGYQGMTGYGDFVEARLAH